MLAGQQVQGRWGAAGEGSCEPLYIIATACVCTYLSVDPCSGAMLSRHSAVCREARGAAAVAGVTGATFAAAGNGPGGMLECQSGHL